MKELQSLSDIFAKKIYRIPDYQRGYAWGEKQLQEFWEDLINLNEDRMMHYCGVLSLKAIDSDTWKNWDHEKWLIEERDYKPFYIVDGQQRLTTFVIFIQALMEAVRQNQKNKDEGDEDIYIGTYSMKEVDENYIKISKPPQHIIKTYKFGYEKKEEPSFRFLRHNIFDEPSGGTIEETFYTLNLENAKTFFLSNLKAHFENAPLAIETIYKKITQKFMFNVYEISDDFDVFVAFEAMNNRGKKLSDLELLKNRLIYLTTLYSQDELTGDVRNTVRNNINDAWKEIYYQLGRNKSNPLNDDDFLRAHWIMFFKYTRKKGKAYIRFLLDEQFSPKNVMEKVKIEKAGLTKIEELEEEWADVDPDEGAESNNDSRYSEAKLKVEEINDYVNSLKESAMHWYNNHNPASNSDLTKEEQLWLDRLNRIEIGSFRPLIMSAFSTQSVTKEQCIELLKAIERFIFLSFRLSRSLPTYRNSAYFSAARELYRGEKTIKQIISMLEEDLKFNFNSDGSFNHNDFKNYILRKFKDGKGFYDWNGLRYFLFEYEEEVMKTRGQPIISWTHFVRTDKDKVSIEHIYPQTPKNSCWNEGFENHSEEEKRVLQGTLGNLLPLSQSINSSLQNDCFKDKKQTKRDSHGKVLRNGYSNGSFSELEVAEKEKWTPVEIKERGLKLLKFMEERWDIKFKDEEKMDILHLKFVENTTNQQ